MTETSDSGAPGASEILGGGPPLTAADARAKHAELLADPAWKEAYLKGSAAHVAEAKNLFQRMTVSDDPQAQATAREAAALEAKIDGYLRVANLSPEVCEQIRQRTPVSIQEKQLAAHEISRLKSDKIFCRQLLEGQRDARTRWVLAHLVVSSPTKEN